MPSFGLESKGHSSFVPEHYKSKTILVTPFKDWFVFTKKKKKKVNGNQFVLQVASA